MDNAPEALPPLEDLDSVFTLPQGVNIPDEYRQMYEVLVTKMRREAQHLPMNTVQLLLIDRIAYNYIVLRMKENAAGTENGFAHATAQKEFNTFWLSMTQEFNKNLRAADADAKANFMKAVKKVLSDVLDTIPDDEIRKTARGQLAVSLAENGL